MVSSPDDKINKSWRNYVRTDVRTLVAIVGCCGVLFWTARIIWESQHAAIAAARGLRARKASDRITAVRDLESVEFQESALAIRAVIPRLLDADPEVRAAAAKALGTLGGAAVKIGSFENEARAAVSSLTESLKDREAASRIEAATALGTIAGCDPGRVIDLKPLYSALMEMLGDGNAEVRAAAIRALGVVGPGVAVKPPSELLAALEDESAQNRTAAVDAAASFTRGLHRSMPWLLRSVERARPEVRGSYVRLLDRIRPPRFSGEVVLSLIMALESRQREIRATAAARLAGFRPNAPEAIPALIPMLREPIESDPVGPGIASLERISREPALAAAEALGQIAPGTNAAGLAVAALAEAVRSENLEERTRAAGALERFGPEAAAAVPALIAALRQTIATEKPVVAFTRENIPNDSQLAGVMIIIALARIAPGTAMTDEVVTVLTEAFSSRSIYTRTEAIAALGGLGPEAAGAIPRLRTLQNDPDPDVREASKAALKRLEE